MRYIYFWREKVFLILIEITSFQTDLGTSLHLPSLNNYDVLPTWGHLRDYGDLQYSVPKDCFAIVRSASTQERSAPTRTRN